MSDKKLDKSTLLESSKHFCMLPWVHAHVLPNSNVTPCCVWPYDKPLGNLASNSLKEIWNNDDYKNLRLKMLEDREIPNCRQCYERAGAGGSNMRRSANTEWAHLFEEIVEPTRDDGELKDFKMAFFDVRFSNICNLKCRGCSPELSSAWQSDHEKLYHYKSDKPKLVSIMPNENAWNELVSFLPYVERAYFAGGEPLIMDEHYLMLEELIRLGKTDVGLSYNSNFSNLRFRDKHITDYWSKFKHVHVGVSIDDIGKRGEYFRHGMNWEKTVENILTVQKKCPHVIFSINCTVSLFNVYYLPQIHSEAFKLGLIGLGDFFTNLLLDPVEYRVHTIPLPYRQQIAKHLTSYVRKMLHLHAAADPTGAGRLQSSFQAVINFLLEGEEKASVERFLDLNSRLDEIRHENFFETFPELGFLKTTSQTK